MVEINVGLRLIYRNPFNEVERFKGKGVDLLLIDEMYKQIRQDLLVLVTVGSWTIFTSKSLEKVWII